MRMVSALLGAGLCVLSWAAFAQDIDSRRFTDLAKKCQASAAAPASPAALKIRDVALAQHRSFRGSRLDHTGRITFFGPSEAESDQENDGQVTPQQVPWHQVWRFWEDLQGRTAGNTPHGALEVWFYPEITVDNPPSPVSRKRAQLASLLRAIDRLDFSTFGEDAAHVKAALQQSAIRASITDVAWSAAFIGSVMRQAGLSPSAFSYSSTHIRYIIASIEQSLSDLEGREQSHFFRACDPDLTRPRVGDLYCYHRHIKGTRGPYTPKPNVSLFRSLFRDLVADPSIISRSHCDIVVRVDEAAKKVAVVGGNVQNSVTEKVLNLNQQGVLSASQGAGACTAHNPDKPAGEESSCNLGRQKWFVLLQTRP